MSKKNKNLYYLDELLNYKVASNDSDVRGWEVKDADNRIIGKVDRLLANKKNEQVLYLDVEVDKCIIETGHEVYSKSSGKGAHEFLNEEGENHLIIPIGSVRLDTNNKNVHANKINYDTFTKTKRFLKNQEIDRNYEIRVFQNYFPTSTFNEGELNNDMFYEREEFKHLDKKS